MHNCTIKHFNIFLQEYVSKITCDGKLKFLDVGSYDVNGNLKTHIQKSGIAFEYTGLDIEQGKNVDVVGDAHNMPFENNSFDVVVSANTFEHDTAFWITFKEMLRVCKPGGLLFIICPSEGAYHAYPVDCWRFKIDSWLALEKSDKVILLERGIDTESEEQMKDTWAVYKKP